jgi:hypothetical protein
MNTVLYYPHIFPSPDWLKLAALCWNHVYRFVPANWSYDSHHDELAVNELNRELGGILRDVQPETMASFVDNPFINWVETHKTKLEYERQYQYHKDEIHFYSSKISNRVQRYFYQEGFRREGPYVLLPEYIAHYYLSLCASEAVKHLGSDAATNEQKFTDIIFDTSPLYGEVATAVLKAYLPENLITLDPKRIKDLRSGINAEKLKYQAEILSLVDKYSKVSSADELEFVKMQIIEIATQEVEQVKESFKRSNQKIVLQAFSISLAPPALAASIASMLGIAIIAPVAIVGALSLFTAGKIIEWNEAKAAKSDSPWSYVLNLAQM